MARQGVQVEQEVKLLQGDCLELLKDIPDGSVDMVLTDPPYGIDYQSQWKKNKSEWMPKIKNDKRPFIDFIPLIKRVLTPTGCVMVFTRWDVQQKFIDEMNGNGLKVKNVLIWDKEIHGPVYGKRFHRRCLRQHEPKVYRNGVRPRIF